MLVVLVALLVAGPLVVDLGAAPAASLAIPTQWCGVGVSAADRLPDAIGGRQIHVIYAVPADGPERFVAAATEIATDLATIDAWWRREDPTRTLRFDTFPFPGCSGLGQLDISFVRLPQATAFYAPLAGRFDRLITDLVPTHSSRGKKYLVYVDAAIQGANVCGQSRPTFAFAFVYLGVPRCGTLGGGAYAASTAAHELVHALGAVPVGAPHRCSDSAHTCDNGSDLMHPNGSEDNPIETITLDVGRDDYYAHSGSWPDVQDSPFLRRLQRPQQQLTVALAGSAGASTVSSEEPGIDCPQACSVAWDGASRVTLRAIPADNLRFVRWSGACTGTDTTCELTMDGPKTATALFGPSTYTGRVSVVGKGLVTNPATGLRCARTCSARFDVDQTFAFKATPVQGWKFTGWAGDCRGRTLCRLRFDKPHAVRATFTKLQ
ncbi:MAG TPA: hypothetical protein VNJ54_12770 [Plantibacter sp.]|uniref:InlB B-repeat-containing protein n=1 Tax=Plantibacter sp. TaxID=1871045 RepID=UPI002C78C6CA|nr:hypothetical protein [Plantibacter sp.]